MNVALASLKRITRFVQVKCQVKGYNKFVLVFIKISLLYYFGMITPARISYIETIPVFSRGFWGMLGCFFLKYNVVEEWHGCRLSINKIHTVLLFPVLWGAKLNLCLSLHLYFVWKELYMIWLKKKKQKNLHHFFVLTTTMRIWFRLIIFFFFTSGEIAKWLLSSWALWKKQFMLSLNFTIMT